MKLHMIILSRANRAGPSEHQRQQGNGTGVGNKAEAWGGITFNLFVNGSSFGEHRQPSDKVLKVDVL